jgi:UDP-3-O-[3-hydroxymyristoyl] glucosamine N-acyltransferase
MVRTIQQLAEMVGGRVEGDEHAEIEQAQPLHDAGPTAITFVDHERHYPELCASPAGAAVVSPTAPRMDKPLIRVTDPRSAFTLIARHFRDEPCEALRGIDPLASIDPTSIIGPDAVVEPFARIGAGSVIGARCRVACGAIVGRNCRLGDDVTLHPHVVIYDGAILGDRVTVHANSVLGADGFGYKFENGRHMKVPQLGHVEIGSDVEIGACTTIDRGTFGATRVGDGTKIDNLVMIAHNCQIGRHNILISQMGMAGSSKTGDYVTIAGQVGVVGHVQIGDRCTIGGQAAVTKDVAAGSRMLGSPATPEGEQKRMLMALSRLPELKTAVRRILRHLNLTTDQSASVEPGDAEAA